MNQNISLLDNSVSIIVPTRNEAENVAPLASQILARPIALQEILFVDDSTDGTSDVIRSLAANHPIRLIEQDHAQPGLAAEVMSGAEAATGTFLLVMDADVSHPPDRIKDLLAPLVSRGFSARCRRVIAYVRSASRAVRIALLLMIEPQKY
jgi:dolichol-phosphate mannosyltransferase